MSVANKKEQQKTKKAANFFHNIRDLATIFSKSHKYHHVTKNNIFLGNKFLPLLCPFVSSFDADADANADADADADEKMSRPHLGDLSLRLLITFLEISLIEKSLDFGFASLASEALSVVDTDADADVSELGKVKVNRLEVRISSLESCLGKADVNRKLGLERPIKFHLSF